MPDQLADALVGRMGRAESINKLRELWDEPSALQKLALPNSEVLHLDTENGRVPTIIPHPPQFQPRPLGVGQDVGKLLEQILTFAPALQGRIGKVQFGPSQPMFNALRDSRFHPEDLERLNIMGATSMSTGDIGLNPSVLTDTSGFSLPATLAHEVTHAAGYANEQHPEVARRIVNKLGGVSPLIKEVSKRQ